MQDLISRQAAIEINRSYHGQMPNEVNHRIWKEINDLPSAQPEPCVDTGILDRFSIYQIEWLRSHNDIEFMPDEEDLIVRFLNDTLHCFKLEHQEKVDTPTVDTPTCEDAVSRQAVKEWLAKWEGYIDADIIARMQYRIIDIPSAQPEMNLDEWCTDCKEYDKDKHCCPRWNRVIRQTLKDAQPEIVRCKDCKYWIAHDKRCVYLNHGFAPNMWCCHGERRTDE